MMTRAVLFSSLMFLAFLATACTGEAETPPPTHEQIAPSPPPTLDLNRRLAWEEALESLRQLEARLSELWETLATGGTVACGEDYPLSDINQWGGDFPVEVHLATAAQALNRAIELWLLECNQPRPQVPPEIIGAARLQLKAAQDALSQAEGALN
jgi:hypothetical protein